MRFSQFVTEDRAVRVKVSDLTFDGPALDRLPTELTVKVMVNPGDDDEDIYDAVADELEDRYGVKVGGFEMKLEESEHAGPDTPASLTINVDPDTARRTKAVCDQNNVECTEQDGKLFLKGTERNILRVMYKMKFPGNIYSGKIQLENKALADTEAVIKKNFSEERQAVKEKIVQLVREVQMGTGDKMKQAMEILALTKSEMDAKNEDRDLAPSVTQNLGMLRRAMEQVTGNIFPKGAMEGITEQELEEYVESKSLSSLMNRRSFDAMARLQDKRSSAVKSKPVQIKKPVEPKQLELFNSVVENINTLLEKNVPTDKAKWSYYKSQAKKKFEVYPSAYANAWAAKKYKAAGGRWRTEKKKKKK
tara:strand:- start:556 stop:1644 length:1089 start_codon:yes stop_codon:yes gene_type:complete